jgi:hypothetical protein
MLADFSGSVARTTGVARANNFLALSFTTDARAQCQIRAMPTHSQPS